VALGLKFLKFDPNSLEKIRFFAKSRFKKSKNYKKVIKKNLYSYKKSLKKNAMRPYAEKKN